MNGLLSILLVADRHTTDVSAIRRLVDLARDTIDEHDLMIVANGCSAETYNRIAGELATLENAKLIKLAVETDPDSAIMEGLLRAIGDYVFIGSVQDAAYDMLPRMCGMASDGHEVVVARPRNGHKRIAIDRLEYGSRLMTRAAAHYVTHAGTAQKSAYHLLPFNPLFAPVILDYTPTHTPAVSVIRGLRRRWRAIISSQVAPLRIVSLMALFGASANILYSVYIVSVYFFQHGVAPGWATLSLQSAGMNLIFSLALFVLCEYLINVFRAEQVGQQVRVVREIRSRTVTYDRENLERV